MTEAKKVELEKLSTIQETSKGPIEYRIYGEKKAPYMLLFPGTPGLCHGDFGYAG